MIAQLNAIRTELLNARDAAHGTPAVAPIDRALEDVDDLLLLLVKGDRGTPPSLELLSSDSLADVIRDIALPFTIRAMAVTA